MEVPHRLLFASVRTMSGKLFIKTHGCQMNEYDSAKMVDVLAASHGLEVTQNEAEADVILINTCSIREKAQEKVFSQLGRWRELKAGQSECRDRRRRLRGESGRRGHRQTRAVRRSGVRSADIAPPAADDRSAARDEEAAGRHFVSGNREVRSSARTAQRRPDGVRVDHGRLFEILFVLRRAVHARRGNQPAVR